MKNIALRRFRRMPAHERRNLYIGHVRKADDTVDVYERGDEQLYAKAAAEALAANRQDDVAAELPEYLVTEEMLDDGQKAPEPAAKENQIANDGDLLDNPLFGVVTFDESDEDLLTFTTPAIAGEPLGNPEEVKELSPLAKAVADGSATRLDLAQYEQLFKELIGHFKVLGFK